MVAPAVSPERNPVAEFFDASAEKRDRWIRKNRYYHQQMAGIFSFLIPKGSSVLEVGSGTGDLLNALEPGRGVGIDISPKMMEIARKKYPHLEFRVGDVERLPTGEKFEYVVVAGTLAFLHDVQAALENIHQVCTPRSRLIIAYFSSLWDPMVRAAEALGIKEKQPVQNWLAPSDIENLLDLAGYEIIRRNVHLLLPKYVPLLSTLCNRYLVKLPFFRLFGLLNIVVARPKPVPRDREYSCSVIIPARNEAGNIEQAVLRTPQIGTHTELVFVEGNSTDNTFEEIKRVAAAHPERDIKFVQQDGKGKGDAVRKGFSVAGGDVLMILDADLTVAPEDLPRFYEALVRRGAEFVHGSRLVYPMEQQAMRFLNMVANKFFGAAFSFLLGQRFKDTLCGTKVLFRSDYEMIAANRAYFGDFDPFGDFDLIFGAAKLNLKIAEIPIHYRQRLYGATNISRFRHGLILLRMTLYAMWKMKFV